MIEITQEAFKTYLESENRYLRIIPYPRGEAPMTEYEDGKKTVAISVRGPKNSRTFVRKSVVKWLKKNYKG